MEDVSQLCCPLLQFKPSRVDQPIVLVHRSVLEDEINRKLPIYYGLQIQTLFAEQLIWELLKEYTKGIGKRKLFYQWVILLIL